MDHIKKQQDHTDLKICLGCKTGQGTPNEA